MALDAAVTEALELASSHPSSAAAKEARRAEGARTLSPREQDVLALLASGSTDREIADALFISRRTAQGHVARILDKLDVPNRAAAAAVASREGIGSNNAVTPDG